MNTNIQTSTLRPGLLVNLKTSIRGNAKYNSRTIDASTTAAGVKRETWETTKTVLDPVEFEAAKRVRGDARALIQRACSYTAFGMLCPDSAAEELSAAINEARDMCRRFNETAQVTRVAVYVLTGRIEPSDENAVRAITSEVRDLMAEMEDGIKNMDAKAIREAAAKARNVGSMLSPLAEARVKVAIDAARAVATKIIKAGAEAAMEVDRTAIRKIAEQRVSFLDMDDAAEVQAPQASARGLDLVPEQTEQPTRKAAKAAAIDLD